MPSNQVQKQQKATLAVTQVRSGPIPSPEEMAMYKKVDANLPSRIMTMAEQEQSNQFSLRENMLNKHDLINKRDFTLDVLALASCTFLCALFITLAGVLFYADKNGAGAFFTVTAFVVLPKTFLWPRRKGETKKDR